MNGVTTVSYRYNINGEYSKLLKTERGIRQEDPISLLFFMIVMKYLSRLLQQMQQDPNFNHHSKCERLGLTHLTFVDDVLFFSRSAIWSATMMHQTLQTFSNSTGLMVNPLKCHIYLEVVDKETKHMILEVTGFSEGTLPFRYLGVPLTSRKLTIAHYMPLIDKIICRIHHWSARLLSQAGRVRLVKAIGFSIANYWLQCFPIPKAELQKIRVICRTFIWTRGTTPSRKNPIAWKSMCKPMSKGGLNLLDLERWNAITMMKLLWDLCRNTDSLWVK